MSAHRNRIAPELIQDFLAREDEYLCHHPEVRDGSQQAVDAIERFALELKR